MAAMMPQNGGLANPIWSTQATAQRYVGEVTPGTMWPVVLASEFQSCEPVTQAFVARNLYAGFVARRVDTLLDAMAPCDTLFRMISSYLLSGIPTPTAPSAERIPLHSIGDRSPL